MTDPSDNSPLRRFRRSMVIDLAKWREGLGYDLGAIEAATPEERASIESLLLHRSSLAWYDIEALAALGTPRAQDALLEALRSPDAEIQAALSRFAPELIGDSARTAALVHGIQTGDIFGGLTAVLLEVEEFHPPAVIEALLRGAEEREGEVAMHLAAMVLFLHRLAREPFDWEHRPFLLRFHTKGRAERVHAVAELRERIRGRSPTHEEPPTSAAPGHP